MNFTDYILGVVKKHTPVLIIAGIVLVSCLIGWFYLDEPEGPIDTLTVEVISSEWESEDGESKNQNVLAVPYGSDVVIPYTLSYPELLESGQILTIDVYLRRMSDKRIYKIVDVEPAENL